MHVGSETSAQLKQLYVMITSEYSLLNEESDTQVTSVLIALCGFAFTYGDFNAGRGEKPNDCLWIHCMKCGDLNAGAPKF